MMTHYDTEPQLLMAPHPTLVGDAADLRRFLATLFRGLAAAAEGRTTERTLRYCWGASAQHLRAIRRTTPP